MHEVPKLLPAVTVTVVSDAPGPSVVTLVTLKANWMAETAFVTWASPLAVRSLPNALPTAVLVT